MTERFRKQIEFVLEIDKLKSVYRRSHLVDGSRNENDAEHSWHLAVMAMLLAEYAGNNLDVFRVVKMVLVHDLVEILVGDTYCYDAAGREGACERERQAAEKLFAMLPADQGAEFRALWEEFEACASEEARFGAILDRLQPLLLNYFSTGKSWREHGINKEQVLKRNEIVLSGPEPIRSFVAEMIDEAVKLGFLKP